MPRAPDPTFGWVGQRLDRCRLGGKAFLHALLKRVIDDPQMRDILDHDGSRV